MFDGYLPGGMTAGLKPQGKGETRNGGIFAGFMVLLLAAILLGIGALLVFAGVQACSTATYRAEWRTSWGIGLVHRTTFGVSELRGGDAVAAGVGLGLLGLMLTPLMLS